MKQAKTCEEYVLDKMMRQEEEIGFLNAEIKRLSDIIKNYENPKKEGDEPSINESIVASQPGDYYKIFVSDYHDYNDILKQNHKDPAWLRLALEDDVILDEFINCRYTLSYDNEKVGELTKSKYSLIVKDY